MIKSPPPSLPRRSAAFLALGLCFAQLTPLWADEAAVLATGLAAWRKPDANGLSCVDCHTPNAYDLAQFNFSQADVRLATTPHLTQTDADAIFAMLQQLRTNYPPSGGLKNFTTFRPLQPGGGAIAGGENATPDVRDAAFGQYLQYTMKFAQNRVTTLAEARAAAQELIDIDLFAVPVGIKFNLYSRSVLREGAVPGGEIAEWLTSTGLVPKPEYATSWRNLHNAYIADPSTANMWAIYHASGYMVNLDAHNFNGAHANWKWIVLGQWRGNFLFTHDELLKARGLPSLFDGEDGVKPFDDAPAYVTAGRTPYWAAGDNARVVQNMGVASMPRRNRESVSNNTSYNGNLNEVNGWQIRDFRLTWFWAGWLFDNALRFSGTGSSFSGEYFIESLWAGDVDNAITGASSSTHGYRMHQVFFNAVHQYKLGFKAGCWPTTGEPAPQHFTAFKGYYLAYNRWKTSAAADATDIGLPGANALYKRMLSNHIRMNVLIHDDEIKTIGKVYCPGGNKSILLNEAELWREVLNWADPTQATLNNNVVNAYKTTVNAYPGFNGG